ncbi:hypothetical protein K439DRAFT_1371876, partial [Ramaria rubella]
VSRVRVRSEHCVGFLKGRWSSLHGLRLHIDNPSHIRFAVIWVTACIVLHNFAMLQEAEEDDRGDVELNEFFREGLGLIEEEQRMHEARNLRADEHIANDDRVREVAQDGQLIRGRLQRERLKNVLFEHLGH